MPAIKILATLPDGMLNLSVHEMMQAAAQAGKVSYGNNFVLDMAVAPFWETAEPNYDLIHIHWVEALFDWKEVTLADIDRLVNRLQQLRQQGKKIVITRHNSIPHRRAEHDALLYQKSFELADAVFHMEQFSYDEYQEWYEPYDWAKQQQHFFAPLMIYTQLPNKISKAAARQQLQISPEKTVFMVLGSIRNGAERQLLETIASKLNQPNELLYVAQWPFYGQRLGVKQWRQWQLQRQYPQHRFEAARPIPDEQMQVYLNAADILISPRMDSLNSGLIPLGFSFGLTVLGPATGNMQNILEQSGNPSYNPQNLNTLDESLQQAKQLAKANKGAKNLQFAQQNWSWQRVGEQHLQAYQKIINLQ